MLIDWFTVFAQIVNFLVLVWLLKIFLYKPILQMIEDRQREVKAQLDKARTQEMQAEEEREKFYKKNLEIDQQRNELFSKVKDEAEQWRHQSIAEVRLEAEKQKKTWSESFHREKNEAFRALSARLQKDIFAVAKKTLADLCGANIEDRMVEAFLHRLSSLSKQEKDEFTALLLASGAMHIRTSSALSPETCEKVKNTLQQVLQKDVHVLFVVSPELVAGIELLSDGKKISWSIADYLDSLESQVNEVLTKSPEPNNA